jgi:tetratricopeptide (TPR) repeat protein
LAPKETLQPTTIMQATLEPEDLKTKVNFQIRGHPYLRASDLAHFKGNEAFKNGDYATAEALYSSAINADPSNHVYYLNRSMANLKLQRYAERMNSSCTSKFSGS